MRLNLVALVSLAALSTGAMAQTGIDGSIGADWSGPGVTRIEVAYVAGSGGSTTTSDSVAYNTYFRTDGTYAYFAVEADPARGGAYNGAVNFSNLYFGNRTTLGGSNIGMEVTNNRFFTPVNVANPLLSNNPTPDGYYYAQYANGGLGLAPQYQWSFSNNNAGVIELAIPFAFFTDDPLAMGFGPSTHVWFRTSQSLGYNSVFGSLVNSNTIDGVSERFGLAAIPTPGAVAVLALAGLAASRRRRA